MPVEPAADRSPGILRVRGGSRRSACGYLRGQAPACRRSAPHPDVAVACRRSVRTLLGRRGTRGPIGPHPPRMLEEPAADRSAPSSGAKVPAVQRSAPSSGVEVPPVVGTAPSSGVEVPPGRRDRTLLRARDPSRRRGGTFRDHFGDLALGLRAGQGMFTGRTRSPTRITPRVRCTRFCPKVTPRASRRYVASVARGSLPSTPVR